MPYSLADKLVIGISSRALFDLEKENRIYEQEGLAAYSAYQKAHENDILAPGTAFPLARALHRLNDGDEKLVEIIVMSRNSADTSMRIFNSIKHYGLDIERAALAGGNSITPYLKPFSTDLFLSANESDVQAAINSGTAAGIICDFAKNDIAQGDGNINKFEDEEISQIRIAFDGDAVIFSDEAEKIYQEQGLEAFIKHEKENAKNPLPEGPFAKFLRTISNLQEKFDRDAAPIRTALVTARSAPAHERVIRTLDAWNVRIDEALFLGGADKTEMLKAFGAHIFFDDQKVHLDRASGVVPSARVPYKN